MNALTSEGELNCVRKRLCGSCDAVCCSVLQCVAGSRLTHVTLNFVPFFFEICKYADVILSKTTDPYLSQQETLTQRQVLESHYNRLWDSLVWDSIPVSKIPTTIDPLQSRLQSSDDVANIAKKIKSHIEMKKRLSHT